MAAWVLLSAATLSAACGGSNPAGSPEQDQAAATLRYLPASDVDVYILAARNTIPALNLVRDEFVSVTEAMATRRLTLYWARQFGDNLIRRARALQARLVAIRPKAPELLAVHQTYEEAVVAYIDAFQTYLDQMVATSAQGTEDVNTLLYRGNYLMDRYQLMLSSLRGEWVVL